MEVNTIQRFKEYLTNQKVQLTKTLSQSSGMSADVLRGKLTQLEEIELQFFAMTGFNSNRTGD